MLHRLWVAIQWLIAAALGLLAFAAQIAPKDAESNIAGWAERLGISNVPSWIVSRSTGQWLSWTSGLVLLAYAFFFLVPWIRRRTGLAPTRQSTDEPSPIEIVYANECNKDHIQSRFKRSTALLPDGQPIQHRITLHEYYVGVRNKSQRTLRNVQMTIEKMNLPSTIVSIPCMAETTKTAKVDIPPARLEYFLLGRADDSGDVGFFSPTVLPADTIEAIAAETSRHKHVGMFIVAADGQTIPLLKNDGYMLEFAVYADDAPPSHGTITINARGALEVLVQEVK